MVTGESSSPLPNPGLCGACARSPEGRWLWLAGCVEPASCPPPAPGPRVEKRLPISDFTFHVYFAGDVLPNKSQRTTRAIWHRPQIAKMIVAIERTLSNRRRRCRRLKVETWLRWDPGEILSLCSLGNGWRVGSTVWWQPGGWLLP